MANRRVSIYKHIKLGSGWRFCAVYRNSKNHKLEGNKVLVAGKVVEQREGDFYLSYYEGEKKVWKRVGPSLGEAEIQADLQRLRMKGVAVANPAETQRISLERAAEDYLEDVRLSRRPGTHELISFDIKEFISWSRLDFVDQVERKTLLKFKEHVSRTGRSYRTACNKMLRVNQFLRTVLKQKPGEGLVTVKDARVVEELPEVYTPEQLDRFFAACNPAQHLLFSTFLMSGCRMKELMYLYWDDIDFKRGTLRVSRKPEFDYCTKTHEEREIPLPSSLVTRLAAASNGHRLVFPTRSGKPNDKWLYMCKRIARRAGLNCGVCETCKDHNECEHWYLHRFRATAATTWLRSSIDIKTVQYLLGHRDIESTMRYLAPQRNEQLRSKIDAVWARPAAAD